MIIVPLKGDVIETDDGETFTVAEFTNYKTEGPAVYVDSVDEKTSFFYFSSIVRINDVPVRYDIRNGRVFICNGIFKRKGNVGNTTLPQKTDTVWANVHGEVEKFTVTGYKIQHKAGHYATGLTLLCKGENADEKDPPTIILLSQLVDVKPALGHRSFSRDGFRRMYHDYFPKDNRR